MSQSPRQPSPVQPAAQPQSQATAAPAPHAGPPQAMPAFLSIPPNATDATPAQQTFRQRLNAGDAHWQWKLGLRAVLIILGLIGIGCAAWTVANFTSHHGPYEYELDDGWTMPWALITFSLTVLWSIVCIVVFLMRRPSAPVHPGAQVGIDLILWLAYIPTALFAVVAVMSVAQFGSDGTIGGSYYSSSGYYHYVQSNNTWVWNATSYDSYYSSSSSSRDCDAGSSSSSYYSSYTFANCTEEDAYVNQLWKDKGHRFNTELTACVCQFLALLVHFALFVWACVDTHRRNSRKVSKEAETLAADIVMNMVRAGAIIPAPGQAHMRPMGPSMVPPQMMQGYYSQLPQQYPQQQFQQQQQQQRQQQQQQPIPPQPVVASSSNEKSAGPRYA